MIPEVGKNLVFGGLQIAQFPARYFRRSNYFIAAVLPQAIVIDEAGASRADPNLRNSASRNVESGAVSENCGAYSYASRSFFNCNFEVVGHAHRKDIHADNWEMTGCDLIAQFTQLAEIGSG